MDRTSPPIAAFRALVIAGAAAFVAGAWIGWWAHDPGDGMAPIPAHHLVGTGWAWLIAVPLVVAAVAPYTLRTLRWLLAAPVPAIVVATVALVAVEEGTPAAFPYFALVEVERPWLAGSLAGAAVAQFALVWAFIAAPRERPTRRERRWLAAAIALALLAVAGANLRQDLAYAAEERRFRAAAERELARCPGDAPRRIRVRCSAGGDCAWLALGADTSVGGTFGADLPPDDLVSCP